MPQENYVIISANGVRIDLEIYHYTTIIEMFNRGFELLDGDQFIPYDKNVHG